jgi:hypothetical protein
MRKYLLPKSRIILWVSLSIFCIVATWASRDSLSVNPLGGISLMMMASGVGFIAFIIEQIFVYRRGPNPEVSRIVIALVGAAIVPICAITVLISAALV